MKKQLFLKDMVDSFALLEYNKMKVIEMEKKNLTNRAWIELNFNHLQYNVEKVQKQIPKQTKIMAVVKANACGHGAVLIAKKLNEIGINDFAVATLEEGIELRNNNIKGTILILGYTNPEEVSTIIDYDLTQTLVDEEYSKQLQKANHTKTPVKVHIKINTGMNRLGFSSKEINALEAVFHMPQIQVTGMFSHFVVANEETEKSIQFTQEQMQEFDQCVQTLRNKGYQPGKVHIQASYGIFAKTNVVYDYVRIGIFLYGISEKESFQLKPVLSLKSRITSIHTLQKGETVGYGRTYIAKEQEKIAAVSIGYGDGYPRALSNIGTKVLLHGEYAEVVGRICMDQLMIRISHIANVKPGDIVTLIGKDQEKEITVQELAQKLNTNCHEVITRLGSRLGRISFEQENGNEKANI